MVVEYSPSVKTVIGGSKHNILTYLLRLAKKHATSTLASGVASWLKQIKANSCLLTCPWFKICGRVTAETVMAVNVEEIDTLSEYSSAMYLLSRSKSSDKMSVRLFPELLCSLRLDSFIHKKHSNNDVRPKE